MKYLVNSDEMKEIDRLTIEDMGLPAMVLMERAALKVAEAIEEYIQDSVKERAGRITILSVCGTGNNGADGVAAARILHCKGYKARVCTVGDRERGSEQFLQQIKIAENFGVSIVSNLSTEEYTIDENTILIDAIFGVGLNREVKSVYKDIINKINIAAKEKVFAVDIPSGLSSDTGFPLGIAVRADYTITFGLGKIGLAMYPGAEYAGEVFIADIGFAKERYIKKCESHLNHFIFEQEDLHRLPPRKPYSNKGSYGKVIVVGGSANMSGAAYLSAKAAYKSGAGLVKIMTAEQNRIILQSSLPEALLCTYPGEELENGELHLLEKELSWADVIVIGPGIGRSTSADKLLKLVLERSRVPIIIDGDAIWLLGQRIDAYILENFSGETIQEENFRMEARINYLKEILPKKTIITPHLKELSYILSISVKRIQEELLRIADICARKNEIVFTIKDARTIVAYNNQRYINLSGNSGMATGGSGDVLTGIIAGLIGQGLSEEEAAMTGVYLHGLAGDKAAGKASEYSLMATDIIEHISEVMMQKEMSGYSNRWRNI